MPLLAVLGQEVVNVGGVLLGALLAVGLEVERHLEAVVPHHVHDDGDALILEAAPSPPAQIDRAHTGFHHPARVLRDHDGVSRIVNEPGNGAGRDVEGRYALPLVPVAPTGWCRNCCSTPKTKC